MATPKPAKLRFYVDADTLGLAHMLTAVRSDVTYPGDPGGTLDGRERPPCDIAPSTPDQDWIPLVAERGLVVITRDRRIAQRTAERPPFAMPEDDTSPSRAARRSASSRSSRS